jgi:hypothetical protein
MLQRRDHRAPTLPRAIFALVPVRWHLRAARISSLAPRDTPRCTAHRPGDRSAAGPLRRPIASGRRRRHCRSVRAITPEQNSFLQIDHAHSRRQAVENSAIGLGIERTHERKQPDSRADGFIGRIGGKLQSDVPGRCPQGREMFRIFSGTWGAAFPRRGWHGSAIGSEAGRV